MPYLRFSLHQIDLIKNYQFFFYINLCFYFFKRIFICKNSRTPRELDHSWRFPITNLSGIPDFRGQNSVVNAVISQRNARSFNIADDD